MLHSTSTWVSSLVVDQYGIIDRELRLRRYVDIDHYHRNHEPKLRGKGMQRSRATPYDEVCSTIFQAVRRDLGSQGRNILSKEGKTYVHEIVEFLTNNVNLHQFTSISGCGPKVQARGGQRRVIIGESMDQFGKIREMWGTSPHTTNPRAKDTNPAQPPTTAV